MIDFTKPVQTRDGRPARVLCTDRACSLYKVVALVKNADGVESAATYTLDGEYTHGEEDAYDLFNVPQEYKALATINVVIDGQGRTFIGATKNISEARLQAYPFEGTQIIMGTLELTIKDGKVVDAKVGPV